MDRRLFLRGSGVLAFASTLAPRLAFARAATEKRFLFIIQRGAADGLAIVAPTGDPAYAGLRGDLAQPLEGGLKLDSMFTLHPALSETAKLFAAHQAAFVHAVASPYRERSHFDGQNVLETGGALPYQLKDGWMNRLIGAMPGDTRAVAFAPTIPAALRGPARVTSYASSSLPSAPDDLLIRVSDLYSSDEQLSPLWNEALAAREQAGALSGAKGARAAGFMAATMMAGPAGARIGMIETDGWDTHSAQNRRLTAQLKGLDTLIAAFRDGLKADWSETLVLVATEFGRTAKANGTGGTDHGTGSAVMLIGGGLGRGEVLGDWPGLANAALYEGRDVRPTVDLDALIVRSLAHHFGMDEVHLGRSLFPDMKSAALRLAPVELAYFRSDATGGVIPRLAHY